MKIYYVLDPLAIIFGGNCYCVFFGRKTNQFDILERHGHIFYSTMI